jgi:hypothetical protein
MNIGEKTFQTLDIYLSAFLALHGNQPSLEILNGKVIFTFTRDDDLYKAMVKYNSNEPIPCNSFATAIKMLRGKMLSMRGGK